MAHRIVLITGASSGIGLACARRFAADGERLVLAARRMDRLVELERQLGVPAHLIQLDVTDREGVERALGELPEAFASVDVLINSAGLGLGLEPAERASLDDWMRMVRTNIDGLLFCTRALLPGMVERGRGHVVNLGSVAGSYPYPGGNVYGGTKAFVEEFSLNLRADLLGKGVRVTNIEPGMVETEFSEVRFGGDKERARSVYRGMQPLVAEDIADAIHWAATRPPHVNINRIEVMPINQAFSPFAVHRG